MRGRSSWVAGAPFAAFAAGCLYFLTAPGNPITEAIRPYLGPHDVFGWVGFTGGIILAGVVGYNAWRAARKHTEEESPTDDHSVSVGGNADDSVISTGEGSTVSRDKHIDGDEVHGDKIVYQGPPAQSPATSLHQLPSPPGDFTGREEELRDLREKVKKCGIAISGLQGQGGVGKTALALMLADELTRYYPDAQIYLDLKGVSAKPLTPAEAMAHVIRAWDVTANPADNEDQLSAMYRSTLYDKCVLLLWDNAADAAQVEPLLPPEGCLALVTSRQHFELPGCYTRNLDVMTAEDARDLVLEIAPRVGDQADDLAKLCGYLPFALRKAAGALNTRQDLGVASYMERLGDAKEKLSLIDASLSLSYDLLSAEQQKRWRMLGVFPGSFDASAAAAVWEAERNQAQDELGDLYLRSMVECETQGRYELHDLSRVYADSKLHRTERATAQRRHAEHYACVARTADDLYEKGGEFVLAGLALFDLERASIEAGQHWASNQGRHRDEAAQLCVDYALDCPYVLELRLHPQDLVRWTRSALQAAQRLKSRASEARALGNLGGAYLRIGDCRLAVGLLEQLLAVARELGDRQFESAAIGNLAIAHGRLGDHRQAVAFLERDLAIAREIGDRQFEAAALGNLGNAHHSLGDYPRAVDFHEQYLALARRIGDRFGEGIALWNMSLSLDLLGQRSQAITNAQAALDIYEQIGTPLADSARRKLAEWRGEC